MRIGYIRVSSPDQNPARQLEGIDVEKTFVDKCSGKDKDRPALQQMLEYVRDTDTVVVWSMDRLARNLKDLLQLVEELIGRGIAIEFVKEKLKFDPQDKASPAAMLMLSLFGAFAEFERSIIKERQREGIELAKRRGVYRGRKRVFSVEQMQQAEALIREGVPVTRVAKKLGVSRETIYRYVDVTGNKAASNTANA